MRAGDGYRDIGGMGKSLQELGGLLLISDAGGFWGTEWDDQPIRPENFREWKKKKRNLGGSGENRNGISEQRRKKAESGEKEKNQKDGTLPEVQEYQKKSDRIMTVEEVQEEVLKASETGNHIRLRSASAGITAARQPSPHPPNHRGQASHHRIRRNHRARPAITASAGTIAT